jgi:hypothetical protein
LTEHSLCLFAAFLHNEGLRPQSISVYLAGLHHLHIAAGFQAPPSSNWVWLQYVLKGIKRTNSAPPRIHLPIAASILSQILQVWSSHISADNPFEPRLLWASACLALFGFLRLGELLPANESSPAPLCLDDVSVDCRSHPSLVQVFIRRAKNDPFGKGARVNLGKTNSDLCPVTAICNYLAIRPAGPGPLLLHHDSHPLLRDQFIAAVKAALQSAGLVNTLYSGHSFRIGAATSAASAGVPAHLIQAMGRWSLDAYLTYIRAPPQLLASVSPALASNHF